jgi:osmotically-inducible protein OsmY
MVLLATSAPDRRDSTNAPVSREMAPGGLAEGLLRNSAYLALRRVRCEFHDGTATLNGRLPSYYLKQVAQTLVAQMAGVNAVINHIEVGTQLKEGNHVYGNLDS